MNKSHNNRAAWTAFLMVAVVAMTALMWVNPSHARGDRGRPTMPDTCQHIEQAQCRALLVNSWDGRQVVHQLAAVPDCFPPRMADRMAARLEHKNHKLRELRRELRELRQGT
jgi:hypothetical protein